MYQERDFLILHFQSGDSPIAAMLELHLVRWITAEPPLSSHRGRRRRALRRTLPAGVRPRAAGRRAPTSRRSRRLDHACVTDVEAARTPRQIYPIRGAQRVVSRRSSRKDGALPRGGQRKNAPRDALLRLRPADLRKGNSRNDPSLI